VATDAKETINMANKFLENEKVALEEKITEARNKGNENTYKNLIQAYERVLELIRKENVWTEFSSHYYDGEESIKGENEYVATWKQRNDGEIKDHKIYKIEKEVTPSSMLKVNIEIDKNYIIDGNTLTIPIKVNGKEGFSIKGKRVDNKWVLNSGTTIKCN
jgi:hypothetical protein